MHNRLSAIVNDTDKKKKEKKPGAKPGAKKVLPPPPLSHCAGLWVRHSGPHENVARKKLAGQKSC
jgi:hypothetical protein